jgi:hypothetical protein
VEIAAWIDAVIGIVLLAWWIFWSRRMLALQELTQQHSRDSMNILREMRVDSRTLTKRLTE